MKQAGTILNWLICLIVVSFAIFVLEKHKEQSAPNIPEQWRWVSTKNVVASIEPDYNQDFEPPLLVPGGTLFLKVSSHNATIEIFQKNSIISSANRTVPFIKKRPDGKEAPVFSPEINVPFKIPSSVDPRNGNLKIRVSWSTVRFEKVDEQWTEKVTIRYYKRSGSESGIDSLEFPIFNSTFVSGLRTEFSAARETFSRIRLWFWITVIVSWLAYFLISLIGDISKVTSEMQQFMSHFIPVWITGPVLFTAIFATLRMENLGGGGVPWLISALFGVPIGFIIFSTVLLALVIRGGNLGNENSKENLSY